MSVSRVKYIKSFFPVSSYITDTANGKIIINTGGTNHGLFEGIPVTITSGASYDAVTGSANVTSANTFSVPCNKHLQKIDNYCINGFITGQTGVKAAETLPRATGTETIIQSYVTGTGGANYLIDVSLDKDHWIATANVSHGTDSGNTSYITLSPGWAYMRPNVQSIGANTNLVIMSGE